MKQMIYTVERLNTPEQLVKDTYKALTFYVLNLGTHPCAYIDVTNTPLNGVPYTLININCHGGLTYSSDALVTEEHKGWFIGWDYSHYDDYCAWSKACADGKKWTTEEIVLDCKNVIDQILKA